MNSKIHNPRTGADYPLGMSSKKGKKGEVKGIWPAVKPDRFSEFRAALKHKFEAMAERKRQEQGALGQLFQRVLD